MARAVAMILDTVITIFLVVLFARVILSWIRLPYNAIIHAIYQMTEPILAPVRRRLPLSWGIDFSPMIIFLILLVIRIVVIDSILGYVNIYHDAYLRGVTQ
jgi:YggT family protein